MAKNFVITRYRDSNSKLRTQLLRIRAKAGVGAWPRLFQNLRSTRETESAENFPDHVVCAWNGNSERVAREHYLQITDDHFKLASTADPACAAESAAVGSESERNGRDSKERVLASSPKNLNSTPSGSAPCRT